MLIETFENPDFALAAAGKALADLLLSFGSQPLLLLSSGGSALELLNRVPESAMGEHLTVTMLDERFSQDPAVSNFLQLQKTEFYEMALSREVNFLGTVPRLSESKEDLAFRLEKNLKNWKTKYPQGKIVATFGMGEDGHTAGIFPYPENPVFFHTLFESENWVVAYNATGKNAYPERITATFSFFKEVDDGIAIICGQKKSEAFLEFQKNSKKPNQLPVLGLYAIQNLHIFSDL